MPPPPEFQGSFARTAESATRARKILRNLAKTWLDGQTLVDFEVAIGEALANAVEHGGGDSLLVSCRRDADRIVVDIKDEGTGFAADRIRVTRAPSGAPRGYGLFIMHKIADEVEILDGGTRLRLVKKIPFAGSAQSDSQVS